MGQLDQRQKVAYGLSRINRMSFDIYTISRYNDQIDVRRRLLCWKLYAIYTVACSGKSKFHIKSVVIHVKLCLSNFIEKFKTDKQDLRIIS